MNPFTFPDQFPVISLSRGGVQKARVPHERGGDASPVDEVNRQLVGSDDNVHRARIGFND
jgi:hypothetical protein